MNSLFFSLVKGRKQSFTEGGGWIWTLVQHETKQIYLMLSNLKLAPGHCLALTSHSAANPDVTVMSQWCHSVMSVENDTVHVHYEPHCHCDVRSDSRLEFPGCLLGLLYLNPPRHHEYQDFVLKSLMRLWVLIPPGRLDLHTTLSMFLNSCKTVNDKNKNVVAILRAFKHIWWLSR